MCLIILRFELLDNASLLSYQSYSINLQRRSSGRIHIKTDIHTSCQVQAAYLITPPLIALRYIAVCGLAACAGYFRSGGRWRSIEASCPKLESVSALAYVVNLMYALLIRGAKIEIRSLFTFFGRLRRVHTYAFVYTIRLGLTIRMPFCPITALPCRTLEASVVK